MLRANAGKLVSDALYFGANSIFSGAETATFGIKSCPQNPAPLHPPPADPPAALFRPGWAEAEYPATTGAAYLLH